MDNESVMRFRCRRSIMGKLVLQVQYKSTEGDLIVWSAWNDATKKDTDIAERRYLDLATGGFYTKLETDIMSAMLYAENPIEEGFIKGKSEEPWHRTRVLGNFPRVVEASKHIKGTKIECPECKTSVSPFAFVCFSCGRMLKRRR